jgi:DedD protein
VNTQFINRLVGTVIVVVAAIVFIPNILDGEKAKKSESFKAIPERPEFKPVDLDPAPNKLLAQENLPVIPVIDEMAIDEPSDSPFDSPFDSALTVEVDNKKDESSTNASINVSTKANTNDSSAVNTVSEAPSTNTGMLPEEIKPDDNQRPVSSNLNDYAWVIQLGAFSHKENLQALLDKLKKAGFTAFTQPIKTPSGSLTKVFVGPELDKAKLESQLAKLKKLTTLEGRVTRFEITN